MRRLLVLAAAAIACAGCDTAKAIQNRKVMAAFLIQSPPTSNPSTGTTIPSYITAHLYLGERQDNGDPTTPPAQQTPPAGVEGATVTLSWLSQGNTATATLTPTQGQPGHYGLVSGKEAPTDSKLEYIPHATYTFSATVGGETFSGTVEAAEPTLITEFENTSPAPKTLGPTPYASWADPFTIHRDFGGPTPSDIDIGFYAVYPVNASSTGLDESQITCKNTPSMQDPMALLQLVFDPSPWKVDHFDLAKAQCFPNPGNYVVGLTSVKKGTPSSNLFLGSAILAGTADAGGVILQ